MRRKALTPYAKLLHKIDKEHSAFIRSSGQCAVCGAGPVVCAHIFSRSHMATRWDTEATGNCIPACSWCHGMDHAGIGIFKTWYCNTFGDSGWETLNARANKRADYTVPQLQEILAQMKAFNTSRAA